MGRLFMGRDDFDSIINPILKSIPGLINHPYFLGAKGAAQSLAAKGICNAFHK
jgi:hypothetical protein